MEQTKEAHTYKIQRIFFHMVGLCAVIFLVGLFFTHTYNANAASLKIHNYVTDDSYSYSGAQVNYMINNEKIHTDYPGMILSNGAAIGPYYELFEKGLGTSSNYVDGKKSFTISYGLQTIEMTLGNTEATVNGKKKTMTNAPVVYSFGDSTETYLYVPTRFVAETFGFVYTWDSSTSTAHIQRSNLLYDGKQQINYTGRTPTFSLRGSSVSSENYPGYVFDGTVFFAAEECFKNTGIASYAYAEGSGLIVFEKGDCTVRLVLDSPVAYVNEESFLLKSVPRLIMPQDASTARVYVPAEFVAEALGYTVSYNETTEVFEVSGAFQEESTAPAFPEEKEELTGEVTIDTATYGDVIFSTKTHNQIIAHFTELGYQVPTAIAAYSCLNSDALYLKGIDESKLRITDKADVIEIVISGYHNPFGGKVYYNPQASFLNYCYFRGESDFRITIIKAKELHYYTYSAPDGCVIHFTDTVGMYQDSLRFVGSSESVVDKNGSADTTEIFSGEDMEKYLPEAIFSREHFVIRLPENTKQTKLQDSDEYNKKRFTISIPGNHMDFFSGQEPYNPVTTLKNVQFSYKVANDTTVITFQTTKIQGYSITVAGGYLAVRIANPSEIYDKIIVLDAGHGGIDPGTLRSNVYEKNVNYNVINVYAAEYFKDSDIKVYFTRTTDTKIALQTRADLAAAVEADLFISFHVNANSNSSVNGTSVYYSTSNNKTTSSGLKSSLLAKTVVDRLSAEWNTRNRGILSERFVVIHNNTVPAVLVECGFITNNSDFEKIKDATYQKKAAKALFDAVSEIFDKYPTNR